MMMVMMVIGFSIVGTYDFVTGVGMLGDNHAPFAAMREMARLTKPGSPHCLI